MKNAHHFQHFDTLQLHSGHQPSKANNDPRAVPIVESATYMFNDSEHGAQMFGLKAAGNIYSRLGNPTVDVLEKRMAALEGGVAAVAASSGQAAQLMSLLGLCSSGHNIVAPQNGLFGGTYGQFKYLFKRFNITVKFAPDMEPSTFEKYIDEDTRAIYVESISNPSGIVAPLAKLSEVAHRHGVPLVCDNTCGMGGYIIRPIEKGADIVVHSTTKWIGGHGTALGGVVVDSGKFDWRASPKFSDTFSDKFDPSRLFADKMRWEMLKDIGSTQSAFSAFLTLQGIETLSLRAQRHCDNSMALARWLEIHPKVSWVWYQGLESHRCHTLAKELFRPNAFGGIVCFGVAGDPRHVVDHFLLASNVSHMGDAKTLVIHPSSTTNQSMSEEEHLASGVPRDLIRVSVGIENIEDIIADFDQALSYTQGIVVPAPIFKSAVGNLDTLEQVVMHAHARDSRDH